MDREKFLDENYFKPEIQVFISELFKEAEENGFEVKISETKSNINKNYGYSYNRF
jgi:uncharacterized protein (UPF0335 family)